MIDRPCEHKTVEPYATAHTPLRWKCSRCGDTFFRAHDISNESCARCVVFAMAIRELRVALKQAEEALQWGLDNCRGLTGGDERRFAAGLATLRALLAEGGER